MLSFIRNLRVAQRLALAFAALIAAVAIVAAVGIASLDDVTDDSARLASRQLPALRAASEYDALSQTAIRLVADHLYVQDGDAAAEARTAASLTAVVARRDRALAALREATVDTPAAAPVADLVRTQGRFDRGRAEAVRRSTRETAAGAEDRSGSRDLYVATVALASDAVTATVGRISAQLARSTAARVDEARATGTAAKRTMIVVVLVAALVAIGLAVLTVRRLQRPVAGIAQRLDSLNGHCLRLLSDGMAAVSRGDLTHEATVATEPIEVESRDELGQLSVAFNVMLANAHGAIHSYNDMRGQLAALVGDLTSSAGSVTTTAQQLTSTSEEATRAVAEIATAISDVASGADSQVQQVERVRSLMEDNVAALSSTGRSAAEAAGVAQGARETAERGLEAVASADAAMRSVQSSSQETETAIGGLAERSQRIGDFVETITSLAGQTNLLALNAAIEAARAGEQGRGFAVVADQVRKLAEESQDAAATIAELVGEIQSEMGRAIEVVQDGVRRTEDGTTTVAEARRAFEAIGAAVDDMSTRIAAVAAAGQEVVASSEGVSSDISGVAAVAETSSATAEQVSASTQETSASAQQISASAQELAETARVLDGLVARFRTVAA